MKRGLIMLTLMMLLSACSTDDGSQTKIDTSHDLSQRSVSLGQTETITETALVESSHTIQQINSGVETQSSRVILSQTEEENESEVPVVAQESSEAAVNENEETHAEDSIIIGDSEYINLMHEEKFSKWISVAEKYGAALYAIPYSDVFAIVKDGEVLVGMSSGVANSTPEHMEILCDLMLDIGEMAEKLIEGINHVAQTGESVHLSGTQEFEEYAIFMRDEWIVVSW